MSYFKNRDFWFWGFIVLLVFNISIIGSMAYHIYQYKNEHRDAAFFHKGKKRTMHSKHSKSAKSFIKQLNLNKQQEAELSEIRKVHFKEMRGLKKRLMQVQHQMFDEAGKDVTDSAKLSDYRSQMMDIQGLIADESIKFLGELKKHLTPEQQELMKQHFRGKYGK